MQFFHLFLNSHSPKPEKMKKTSAFILALFAGFSAFSQQDSLQAKFLSPGNEAKPRVWWHWMNGNITKEGITADLDWMQRVGIGGLQNFDIDLYTPVLVPNPVWLLPVK